MSPSKYAPFGEAVATAEVAASVNAPGDKISIKP